MSLIALQVGQAGCQGGAAFSDALAAEALGAGASSQQPDEQWSEAADRFFYLASSNGRTRPTARAVLVDMEPKVVAAAQAAAGRSGVDWQYSKAAALTRQPGSGNNWAQGALRHGPAVQEQVLGMLRRQAERCDALGGFLVQHSLAGGTGSGLGSSLVAALRDAYGPAARILNHCIWPFDSGEVVVQPYNALLSLSSLAQHSDGVILAQNDALAATCQLLGVQRPSFADLNAVAARDLAALLLPATQRQAPSVGAAASSAGPGGRGGGRGAARLRPAWDSSPAEPPAASRRQQPAPAAAAGWDGTFGSGSRWEDDPPATGSRGGSAGGLLHPLADVCERLCAQPNHRLLTLRSCPQVPPASYAFTPFTWPNVLKELAGAGRGKRAVAHLLVLRGDQAGAAEVDAFADVSLYSRTQRHASPLGVAASGGRMGGQQMLATLLSNDQAPVALLERMLVRARGLFAARAYVHKYEAQGLGVGDFKEALEGAEALLDAYRAL